MKKTYQQPVAEAFEVKAQALLAPASGFGAYNDEIITNKGSILSRHRGSKLWDDDEEEW